MLGRESHVLKNRRNSMFILSRAAEAIYRFARQIPTRLFVAAALFAAVGLFGYVGLESIIGAIDSQFSRQLDDYLGIDKKAIARLGDRAYFAEQSMFVSEDQKTVACISSPEHRILIKDPAAIPPHFATAILASEDKNFWTHEGVDKGAIARALLLRLLQQSHSGASTLTMQIAKHLREGTGRQSTQAQKNRRHRQGAADQAGIPEAEPVPKNFKPPYFGRGQYRNGAASPSY